MNQKQLKKLIGGGESQTAEFKQSFAEMKEILETICAFANTNGGVVLAGVSDEGMPLGVEIGKDRLEKIPQKIRESFDPVIFLSINVERIGDKQVVSMSVTEAHEKPVFFKNVAYKRVGRANRKLSASEVRKLAKETSEKVYWDAQVCKGASLDDIDEEKVRWFLQIAKIKRKYPMDETTPLEKALTHLNLLKDGKPTNATLLLFGKNPKKFHTQSEIKCIKFSGAGIEKPFDSYHIYDGNLFEQIDKAYAFVLDNIKIPVIQQTGTVRVLRPPEIPSFVIQEAIVNAVAHRDYNSTGAVQVMVFLDRVEIWNPGELPPQLTVKLLKEPHTSYPHNPSLTDILYLADYIQKAGSGTLEMIKQCKNKGLPDPEFIAENSEFRIILARDIFTESYTNKAGLTKRGGEAVIFVKEKGKITNKEYQKAFDVSERTASRELSGLVRMGILSKVGITGKGTHYKLKVKDATKTPQRRQS